ncbi:MAG: tetratricopeptide repeat protein, partial [Chthoniobacteraceae bacterium]
MKASLSPWMLVGLAAMRPMMAATTAESNISQAKRALAESIPQVAIEKIEAALSSPDLDPDLRPEAVRLLAESLRMSGRHAEALAAIKTLEDRGDVATNLLRAEIFASDGQWKKAEHLFSKLLASDQNSLAARVGLAESLQAQGRTEEALPVLQAAALTPGSGDESIRLRLASLQIEAGHTREARVALAGTKPTNAARRLWHRYLEGRLHLLEGHPDVAAKAFSEVFEAKRGANENLIAAAAIGLAEARTTTNGYAEAAEPLETFIWRFPESAWIDLIFRRLDQVYAHEDDPDENELQQWLRKSPPERAALARYYLARLQVREGKIGKAKVTLDEAIGAAPNHRLTARLHAMRAELHLQAGAYAGAVFDLEAAARLAADDAERAWIEVRTGIAYFRQQEFLLAANSFERAAESDARFGPVAHYDSALASLNQGNEEGFERSANLVATAQDTDLLAQLRLEKGLYQARQADERAGASLRKYLKEFPRHRRAGEARLALSELEFAGGNIDDARHYLMTANKSPHTADSPVSPDRADYLEIFLADRAQPPDDAKVIALANQFLDRHAQSPLAAEVRMK